MKKHLFFYNLITSLVFAQHQFNFITYNLLSVNNNTNKAYFENWTELDYSYKKFQLGLQMEAHDPPVPYSADTSGYGLYQRYVGYNGDNFQVTVGNFYTMLGRGLVLRSFENRSLRWDTNIDGVNFNFQTKYVDGKLLSGKPRDRSGDRLERLDGGELTIKPLESFHFGSSFFSTKDDQNISNSRGSIYTNFYLPSMSLYTEYASRKDGDLEWGNGHAFYLSGDLFVKSITLHAEYKEYDNYHLYGNGLHDYNNPPTVVREHMYTLLNRHQHVLKLNNEKGWLVETNIPIFDFALSTWSYSKTTNLEGDELFDEVFGQAEIFYSENWNWILAGGLEEDRESEYKNFILSSSYNLDYVNAIKFIYEHQHVKIKLTDRQFYNQIYLIEYSRSPYFTLSMIFERATDQYSNEDGWLGIQADVHIFNNYELSLFGGSRREGKMCAGGVCVYKPAFEGIEAIFQYRF